MRNSTMARLARGSAAAMSLTRVAIGLGAVLRPGNLARSWLGEQGGSRSLPAVRVLGRASAGRDMVLGTGGLAALARKDTSAGPWLAAGGVVDAVDGVSTVLAWAELPQRSRGVFVAAAAGTAVLSAAIYAGLVAAGEP